MSAPDDIEPRIAQALGFPKTKYMAVERERRWLCGQVPRELIRQSEAIDPALVTSLGLQPAAVAKLMRDIGFHPTEEVAGWVWRGRERRRPARTPQKDSHAFAALAALKR